MALVRILVDGYSLLHNWPELAPGQPRHSEREIVQVGFASPNFLALFGRTPLLGRWFDAEIRAGYIRDLPRPLLAQQLLGPIMFHLLTRPALPNVPGWSLPDIDTVCDVFADAFVRAVATPSR